MKCSVYFRSGSGNNISHLSVAESPEAAVIDIFPDAVFGDLVNNDDGDRSRPFWTNGASRRTGDNPAGEIYYNVEDEDEPTRPSVTQESATGYVQDTRLDFAVKAALSFALGLFFLYLAYSSVKELVRSLQSVAWPTVYGDIKSARVTSEVSYGRRGSRTTYYIPEIEYEYTVNGRTLRSTRIQFSPLKSTNEQDVIREIARITRPDTKIEVHYDPIDPSEAVLAPGVDSVRQLVLVGLIVSPAVVLLFTAYNIWRYLTYRTVRPNQAATF